MDDQELEELEQTMRAGLHRRADQADVALPVTDRVRPKGRHRSLAVGAVIGLVAASLVTVAVVESLTGSGDDPDPTSAAPTSVASDPTDVAVRWRTETWGDVQVDVPADWGYGGAPDEEGVACFPGASLDAAGQPVRGRDVPPGYVGRPISLTDVCASTDAGAPVDGPYVWLGAGLTSGLVELGNGYVQETVAVDGTTLTVATRDEVLRQRIVGSVRGSESCLSELDRSGPISHDRADDLTGEPVTLRVCAYRADDGPGGWELTYAADLEQPALGEYLVAVADGERPRDQCPAIDYALGEAVVLEILDTDGQVLRQDSVNAFESCAGIAVDARRVWELKTTRLTPEMTRPWVVGGVGAVIHGNPELGFIGQQG